MSAFKEAFVGREVLRTIDEFFTDLDFPFDPEAEATESQRYGQRRSRVAGYVNGRELSEPAEADRVLKAIGLKLEEWERDGDPAYRKDLDRIIRTLDVAGYDWDGKSVTRRAGPLLVDIHGPALRSLEVEDVHREMERIAASVDADPADAITAARALLESVCKVILEERGAEFRESDDLPTLYRKAASALNLDPAHHDLIYRQTLGGLVSAVHGLAELRNKLGDAHGKGRAAIRPRPRHARMIVGAAFTVAGFLAETADAQGAEDS